MLPVYTRGNPRRSAGATCALARSCRSPVHGRGPFPAGNADRHGPARGGSARKGGVRMARPSVTIGARGGGGGRRQVGGGGGGRARAKGGAAGPVPGEREAGSPGCWQLRAATGVQYDSNVRLEPHTAGAGDRDDAAFLFVAGGHFDLLRSERLLLRLDYDFYQ